jgi:hypothetical protein
MRYVGLALLALFVAMLSASCAEDESLLRAKVIEHRAELVGGPVAMADVGDYLLENDQIRVAILRAIDSPGPGVFGGSVVDIDRRRKRIEFKNGRGRDRFAETFPVANLMVPEPSEMEVSVLKDGSDGKEAAIRVEGQGEFLFEALGVLRSQKSTLEGIFPNIKTAVRFTTDYILRPGAKHIFIRTRLELGDELPEGCPELDCPSDCPDGRAEGPDGCLVCACSDVLPLTQYQEPQSVFGVILGDPPMEPDAELEAGIVAGDFVFFGNQNDVFAPGPGFDEDGEVQRANYAGRNTFQQPLIYDYVAAAGGDISYGYFTVGDGPTQPRVNVPLFASAATAFLAAGKQCRIDGSDDETCDKQRTFTFERYLAVGDGDVASVLEEVYNVRGTPVGLLHGNVYWESTGEPVPNARLFLFHDPEPGRVWQNVDELVRANFDERGDPGVLNSADADLGLDLVEDGDFRMVVRPGNYVVVARDASGIVTSAPMSLGIDAGQHILLSPALPTPATLLHRITDELGQGIPCKMSFVAVDEASGERLEGDGRRRPYLGEGRLANGVRHVITSRDGFGEELIEPGVYDVVVSRGPEYSVYRKRLTAESGRPVRLDATLQREVDTGGWMSADMHLHSTPSFDSGMPVSRRVRTVVSEGLELAVSTDHDVATDYLPVIRELNLEEEMTTAVGAEITTLEQGHFIGFPIDYDATVVPAQGAYDWTCQPGSQILDGIRSTGDGIEPLTIVAHPRDGFFGYIDQLGVDAFKMTRSTSLLEANNPVFRVAGCNFDAMEIIQSKRWDLVRTPTVVEMVDYNRCLMRVNTATDRSELAAACPELGEGLVAPCDDDEPYRVCQSRNRTAVAAEFSRRVLERTPAEQAENWGWSGTDDETEDACDVFNIPDGPVPEDQRDLPCAYRAGHVDDYFRYLERGLLHTHIASSDSHNGLLEPGFPRTYFRSEAELPGALDISDAVSSLRGGHAFATYGPFVRASVAGKTFGEVATVGSTVDLSLEVQTASWFGVDRVEIYVNGLIVEAFDPESLPADIEDVKRTVSVSIPDDRDSWIVVIAMGLDPENGMAPVSLDRPFGEIQLANVASAAFSQLPIISAVFPPDPVLPDWAPTFPYAVTNPIYLDRDGNGVYDPPLGRPVFCSVPCQSDDDCPKDQECLDPEMQCGKPIEGRECNRRLASMHH